MSIEIGQKFGKLTVKGFDKDVSKSGRQRNMALCKCDCGSEFTCEKYNLTSGNTTQCKKCADESRSNKRKTHGHSISMKEENQDGYSCYYRWQSMKRRCNNQNDSRWKEYGGRGITVCDRWQNSYEAFLNDMGLPPTRNHQIDRIDNEKGYSKENCRWVTRTENANNKRNNHFICAFGKKMTIADWSKETGIKQETIRKRIERGLSAEESLNKTMMLKGGARSIITPHGVFDSISECARKIGMSVSGLHTRLKSKNYPEWTYVK